MNKKDAIKRAKRLRLAGLLGRLEKRGTGWVVVEVAKALGQNAPRVWTD